MAKMKLLKPTWRYAKQPLVAGDVFDVKDIHIPLLAAAKIAEPADAKAKAMAKPKRKTAAKKPTAKRQYTTRAPTAAKRGYNRRDMTAKKAN